MAPEDEVAELRRALDEAQAALRDVLVAWRLDYGVMPAKHRDLYDRADRAAHHVVPAAAPLRVIH